MNRFVSILFLLLSAAPLFSQEKDAAVEEDGALQPEKEKGNRSLHVIRQFTLSDDFSEELETVLDTSFSLTHRFRFADNYSPLNAELGNYGLPFYQLNFFDRITDPDKYLYATCYPYMYLPDRTVFMDAQRPFTDIDWTYGEPRITSEQTFRVRHTQNINRKLNFGLIYDIIYDIGQYNYQMAQNKTFTLFSAYRGDRYKAYVATGINNIYSDENGGVPEDINALTSYGKASDVPVRMGSLNASENKLKNKNLTVVQRYTIGKQTTAGNDSIRKRGIGLNGTFSYIFAIDGNRKTYTDKSPLSGFYDTVYISKSRTFDSLFCRTVKNTLRFDFSTDPERKFRLGGGVGIRNERHRYSQIVPADTLRSDTLTWKHGNNVLVGTLNNNIGSKFHWKADGEMFFTGYRAGDFRLSGEIVKTFGFTKGPADWVITGSMKNTSPSFWQEHWGGNNFMWDKNLKKEFRVDVGTSFRFPARQLEAQFNYAIIDNYCYFGLDALPAQHEGGLSVASIFLHKNIRMWKFHLDVDLLLQQSGNTAVLSLPLLATRSALYFEHLFKFKSTGGRLNFQIGADVTCHTRYNACAYMPATGRFYNQNTYKTGNYPFIDVFANIKLKRARVFVMLDHLNEGYMGDDFYMIPSYPMNYMMLRYGIAWTFYN